MGHLYTLDPPGYPAGAYHLLPVHTDLDTLLDVDDETGNFVEFLGKLLSLDPDERRPAARRAVS